MTEWVYLAHSGRPDQGIAPQEYGEHVRNSREQAKRFAEECGHYSSLYRETLVAAATLAGEFHDLGKLDDANQRVLAGIGCGKLPVPHVDAGAAHLLRGESQASWYAALTCYSHHRGLPSMLDEFIRSKVWLRDLSKDWREHTESNLSEYLRRHRQCLDTADPPPATPLNTSKLQLLWRLTLSCLADADHSDTSRHYGETPLALPAPIKARERLAALDDYVGKLSARDAGAPRTLLRQEIYQSCRKGDTWRSLYSCDAPVGSGKSTAVMAHLLKSAQEKGLRRIVVVLPYTNIISQAVSVYREALVLDGEIPEDIVAEHHHKADYGAPESRRLTMLWNAPIVVTTAVQFFETLASNRPANLRKLHRLPGSAVFIDEAHAALPTHLWPLAWLWLNELAEHWSCHFVFASGSLSRFWELPDFHPEGTPEKSTPPRLPELVQDAPREHAFARERTRVIYRAKPEAMGLEDLTRWVSRHEGPRLLVLNTVQSAAVVAKEMLHRYGYGRVEHLSTALTPDDREKTLCRVKQRLNDGADSNWTLVATSCIETGVDLSFRVGMRERASLMSLIQLGGRVNRGHEQEKVEVFDFQLRSDNLLRLHPQFKTSARVLEELFQEKKISPEFCREALKREIRWSNMLNDEILKAESTGDVRNANFPKVTALFKVIDTNTVTVVISPELNKNLLKGKWCGRVQLQRNSVQIWGWRAEDLKLEEFPCFPGLYRWPFNYDSFIGYMAGVLPIIEVEAGRPTVI